MNLMFGLCAMCVAIAISYQGASADNLETSFIDILINGTLSNTTLIKDMHEPVIELVVYLREKSYILDLHLNQNFLSVNYMERVKTLNNDEFVLKQSMDEYCYYAGVVRGEEKSMAAIDTCEDIQGFFSIGKASYTISPRKMIGSRMSYQVSKDDNDVVIQKICGFSGVSNDKSVKGIRELVQGTNQNAPPDYGDERFSVELFISASNGLYTQYNSNAENVFSHIKKIANSINLIYQTIGINIILVGSEIFTVADPIVITTDATATLNAYCEYRKLNLVKRVRHDTAHLLTSKSQCFVPSILGYAPLLSMCQTHRSCGVDCNNFDLPSLTGKVMAHEIGHNFGLYHDDQYSGETCQCSVPNQCIMATSVNNGQFAEFSSCSKTKLSSFITQLEICLSDKPKSVFQDLVFCGNGIIDEGETCDCGGQTTTCSATCCNIATCQLIGNAKCASGKCCDIATCKVKKGGTVCRPSSNDCDLVEYCDGVKSRCPRDTYRRNSENCTVDNILGKCYNGKCGTRLSQCKLIWGPATVDAPNFYDRNVEGKIHGNCGTIYGAEKTFVKCDSVDAYCGLLHCKNELIKDNLPIYARNFHVDVSFFGTDSLQVTYDFGEFIASPGLVPDGSICADNKHCVNQKCVDSITNFTGCPTCNQNWICNNEAICQCENGNEAEECWKTNETVVDSTDQFESMASNPINPIWTTVGGIMATDLTLTTTVSPFNISQATIVGVALGVGALAIGTIGFCAYRFAQSASNAQKDVPPTI